MTPAATATLDTVIWRAYRFDRIEITGRRGTGDWQDCEPISLSVPGEFLCEFPSGPNLQELAGYAARLLGPGFYGLKSARPLGFWDTCPRLRGLYDAEQEKRRQVWRALT